MYENGLTISRLLSGVGTARFDPGVFETIDLGLVNLHLYIGRLKSEVEFSVISQ